MSMYRLVTRGATLGVALATLGLILCAGCGPGEYAGPTGTVSGTVTLNGQPVPEGCNVAFISEQGFTASGVVRSGGKYQLSVAGEGDKIPVATYKACVTPSSSAAEMSEQDYDKLMEQSASGKAQPKGKAEKEIVPAKYQATATSGLSYQVKEGPNTINIELQ